MAEDRSLDEFGGADGGTGDTDSAPADSTDSADPTDSNGSPANSDDSAGVDDPVPATPTATWTADGAGCERCGERTERRWLDGGDRVCPECKSW